MTLMTINLASEKKSFYRFMYISSETCRGLLYTSW